MIIDHGVKVAIDRIGSLPVSRPSDSLTLLATNSVCLVRSAYPLTPSPQANLMIWKQLQHPSMQPTQESAQEKRQYFSPRVQFSQALSVSPNLQSMHSGAQRVQQHASQQRQAKPQASIECHWSIHMAVLQAAQEHQQHWQHFFRKSISKSCCCGYYYSKEFIDHASGAPQTQGNIQETQGRMEHRPPSRFGFCGWIIIQLMQGGQREKAAQEGPFEMLKTQVYPVINQIILKLIDHIVKSEEVSKHEERLKRKKIIDQLERKYIERDIQKEEMGSDYEQSDDEQLHKALGMQKEAVETLIRKRIAKHRSRHLDDDSDNQLQGNVFNPMDFIINQLKEHQAKRAK